MSPKKFSGIAGSISQTSTSLRSDCRRRDLKSLRMPRGPPNVPQTVVYKSEKMPCPIQLNSAHPTLSFHNHPSILSFGIELSPVSSERHLRLASFVLTSSKDWKEERRCCITSVCSVTIDQSMYVHTTLFHQRNDKTTGGIQSLIALRELFQLRRLQNTDSNVSSHSTYLLQLPQVYRPSQSRCRHLPVADVASRSCNHVESIQKHTQSHARGSNSLLDHLLQEFIPWKSRFRGHCAFEKSSTDEGRSIMLL